MIFLYSQPSSADDAFARKHEIGKSFKIFSDKVHIPAKWGIFPDKVTGKRKTLDGKRKICRFWKKFLAVHSAAAVDYLAAHV